MIRKIAGVGVVAITGGSCAGKTTLARTLLKHFPQKLSILPEDAFYYDRSGLSEGELRSINWESQESIDTEYFLKVLRQLITGEPCTVPSYDPVSHARSVNQHPTAPTPIIVVEGLHVINIVGQLFTQPRGFNQSTVKLLKLFVDCPEQIRYTRRKMREAVAATIPEDFDTYWNLVCQPFYASEILPQRDQADLVVRSPFEVIEIESIIEWLEAFA